MRRSLVLFAMIEILGFACSLPMRGDVADPRMIGRPTASDDPGCSVATLVSTGGPMPRNPKTLAVRWTGYSNFELVYHGRIILLDAYFDRGSLDPPLGFKAADVQRAHLILLGHCHLDHNSD